MRTAFFKINFSRWEVYVRCTCKGEAAVRGPQSTCGVHHISQMRPDITDRAYQGTCCTVISAALLTRCTLRHKRRGATGDCLVCQQASPQLQLL